MAEHGLAWDSAYQAGWATDTKSEHVEGCQSHNVDYSKCEGNSSADLSWKKQYMCEGHRNKYSNTNTLPDEVESQTVSTLQKIKALRQSILLELTLRKKSGKYKNAKKIDLVDITDNQMMAYTLKNFATELKRFMKDEYTDTITSPSSANIATAKHYNDVVQRTVGMMQDCICYSDCNGYTVCWCHGNCNNY